MHKKYYLLSMICHTVVAVSLCFPVISVSETRLNSMGNVLTDTNLLNIFQYVYNDIYTITAILMIVLGIFEILGALNCLYAMSKKTVERLPSKLAFMYSFSSAIMGALQVYSRSIILFLICVASFVITQLCSIRLMRLEKD